METTQTREEAKQVYRLQGLTCTNCSAKFERNVKEIEGVKDAQVNFGAAKLTVYGEATVQQLEKAGAFDGIKVYPEKEKTATLKKTFWNKKSTVQSAVSLLLLAAGLACAAQYGEHSALPTILYGMSMAAGGYSLFLQGIRNLVRFRFDMDTLMTVAIIGAACCSATERPKTLPLSSLWPTRFGSIAPPSFESFMSSALPKP
ncbi:cation transporter [Paenibacillus thermotolerans]|uniref:cation transporter n=1 Tax=Paenibacillus thermotolerans TaxID=3027807 RepID=UPI003CC530DF